MQPTTIPIIGCHMSTLQKKILITAAFFWALNCAFFYGVVSAEEPQKPAKIIPPLVLGSFDQGTLFTDIGGLTGGDEESPGTLYPCLATDNGFRHGNSGFAMQLDYDVSKFGEFSYYWIKLGKSSGGKSNVTMPLDLSQYNYISFWIKSIEGEGNPKIELHQDSDGDGVFTFDKDISSSVYVNVYTKSGAINKTWQKVTIPLKDLKGITDWSKMLELVFVFENKYGFQKGSVVVDDILFGYRDPEVLTFRDARPVAAPVETSFLVDGASGKQCALLKTVNEFEITAESVEENPYIESVTYECSMDGGNVWRTIGIVYSGDNKIYKLSWQPDDLKQTSRYQIRAVANDLRGGENATKALLDCGVRPITDDQLLDVVQHRAFDFFKNHQSPRTGLFSDTTGGGDASVASTGFGIAALCVGAEKGWIARDEAKKRVELALDAFIPDPKTGESLAEGRFGLFYHFLGINTGRRAGKSEVSTVDTAILICGALTAGEYFGGSVKEKAETIYKKADWSKFLSRDAGHNNEFYMGWSPERGFLQNYWDYYTDEAMLVTLLAIGSPTYPADPEVFYTWTRHEGAYGSGKPYIYSWSGSLFTYQYAHVWFDLRGMVDKRGVDWFENSKNATMTDRQFCIDNAPKYSTYGPKTWGITAMSSPYGYAGAAGAGPTGSGETLHDGTVSPSGPAGSIIFTPELSKSALRHMYLYFPELWGQYGLKDSYNETQRWYAPTYYGINVALMLLPIENYRTGFIWTNFMRNQYISGALRKAGFKRATRVE